MFIAKNLKRLRLEKGLTQEELSERIGVTAQAVSKWERDECFPDITLLPGLANCFGVTVDELIGMAEISDKKKLHDVMVKMHELGNQGKYDEMVELLETALKTFPNEPGLLSCVGTALALAGDTTGRAERLCEQALEESMSYKGRATVNATLCFLYRRSGAADKAESLARSLPHARESREFLLPNFLNEPKRDAYLRENLPGILTAICALIDGDGESDENEIRSLLLGNRQIVGDVVVKRTTKTPRQNACWRGYNCDLIVHST